MTADSAGTEIPSGDLPLAVWEIPRDRGVWWADQHGRAWSVSDVQQAHRAGRIRWVLRDEHAGVVVCRRETGDLLHLVRIPPPSASEDHKVRFYADWDASGRPPIG